MTTESGLIVKRYASALLDLAAEAKALESVEKDVQELAAMIEASPELVTLIENPLMGRAQQQNVMQALAEKAKFQDLTTKFLGVLVHNRRLVALSQILKAFLRELNRRRGGVEAKVQVAHALTPAQTEALKAQLSKTLGAQVTLTVEIDQSLLGGMIVTYGSRMIDDSVKRKLEMLQRAMNANENTTAKNQKEVG